MNSIKKLYYHLTAYFPRKLPSTPDEYEAFRQVLMSAYGLSDEAPIWIAVAGQISSTPAHRIRRPWGEIANAAKRLRINNLARGHVNKSMQELNDKLEAAVKAESERMQLEAQNDQKPAQEQPSANAEPESQAPINPAQEETFT